MTDLTIQKGASFIRTLRWESLPFVYKAITGITKAGPCVITAASHGLKDGWRAAVTGAGGMRQINARQIPPRANEFHKVTYIDANSVSFNDVDSSNYTAYTSGGFLVYYTPVSIASFTARMMIRATVESTGGPLESLVSPTDIVLDDTNHTITITIPAADTAAYTFDTGVYDLELVSAAGVVTKLLSGNIIVLEEVTRD